MWNSQKLSRPAKVANAIKDWVVEQGLQVGDRLPGEVDLIDQFAMAKGTIREAMRLLEAQGLIETRTGPGGGSFVSAPTEERARALLGNYFFFKDLTIHDIYQLRRILEPELAAELAGRLSESDLAELETIVDAYALPARSEEEERDQHVASLRFHAKLAEYAQNSLLGFVIGFMAQILTDITVYRKLYAPHNEELWRTGRESQQRLVQALREGDAATARQTMQDHMTSAERLMEAQAAEVLNRFIAE